MGELFVFEGPDGVGKTSLSEAFRNHLAASGTPTEHLSFPGQDKCTLGHLVYRLHHEPEQVGVSKVSRAAIQAMHIAAHIDAIEMRIRPAIEEGRHVVLDRFWWSTFVYGLTAGVEQDLLNQLIQAELSAWGRIKPTTIFLVRRQIPLRNETLEAWSRLALEYERLAASESTNCHVVPIKNDGSLEDTLAALVRASRRIQLPVPPSLRPRASKGPSQQTIQFHTTQPKTPLVFSKLSPAKPTIVFDSLWRFAAERQAIYRKRVAGTPPPWTSDPILRRHKFTNAYRASDRVSQYLISKVIYSKDWMPSDLVFRVLLFKIFNRIETWELLESSLGEISWCTYDFQLYDSLLNSARERGEPIYSAAYIMPSGKGLSSSSRKHTMHLKLIEKMMGDRIPDLLVESRSMRFVFETLKSYPTLGDFLAFQYTIDLNYSSLTNFSEMEFVIPGPGARDGIHKCFSDLGGLSEADIIRSVTERQEHEFSRLSLDFISLWGRPLQLIDCQNLFCEIAKYSRITHPHFQGLSGRTKIKQLYRPSIKPVSAWFPPKWGLNDLISERTNVQHI